MLDFIVAIPARFAASRLPGKPLRLIGGEPMVVRVARQALLAGARSVVVAADDVRIADALAPIDIDVVMTSSSHQSGTDRLAEVASIKGWPDDQIVVNLQGDEPFAPATGIQAVAALLHSHEAPMATLSTPLQTIADVFDPNAVKVVANARNEALLFSRAPLPWARDSFPGGELPSEFAGLWQRHIGIYAYRAGFLRQFAGMPQGRLERIESLEQLRVMEAGYRIAVARTPEAFPPGVDTEEDLARAERFYQSLQK